MLVKLHKKIRSKLLLKLNLLLQESVKDDLIRSLKLCGSDCLFYMLVQIEQLQQIEVGDDAAIAT